jgi:hypothetical protein
MQHDELGKQLQGLWQISQKPLESQYIWLRQSQNINKF